MTIPPHHQGQPYQESQDAHIDRMIQILSLEYQTLRDDILVRSSGRFQFLGFTTTAAALLASGIFGHSIFGEQTWISVALALSVFAFGLICFMFLGRQMLLLSTRAADIEQRINALVPAEPDAPALLSWEIDKQQRTRLQRIFLDLYFARL